MDLFLDTTSALSNITNRKKSPERTPLTLHRRPLQEKNLNTSFASVPTSTAITNDENVLKVRSTPLKSASSVSTLKPATPLKNSKSSGNLAIKSANEADENDSKMLRSQSVTDLRRKDYSPEKKPTKLFLNNFIEKQQEIEKHIYSEKNVFDGNFLSNSKGTVSRQAESEKQPATVEQKYERLKKEYMNKQNEIEKLKKSRLEQLEKRKYYEKIYQSQVETEQELKTKVAELEIQIGEFRARDELKEKDEGELQELKIRFEKEREKSEKLEKDLVAQQAKLRENIDREIVQSDELLLLSNQKKDLLHQLNKFKVQWEKIKVEKENYLKDMTLINQRVDELVREKELLVIENEEVKLRNEDLEGKGLAHAGALEKLEKGFQAKLKDKESEIYLLQQECILLERRKDEMKSKLSKQIDSMKEESTQLRTLVEEKQQERFQVTMEREEALRKLNTSEQEKSLLQLHRKNKKKEEKILQLQLQQQEEQLQQQADEIRKLQGQVVLAVSSVSNYNDLESERDKLRSDLEEMRSVAQTLQRGQSEREREREQGKKENLELQLKVQQMTIAMNDLRDEFDERERNEKGKQDAFEANSNHELHSKQLEILELRAALKEKDDSHFAERMMHKEEMRRLSNMVESLQLQQKETQQAVRTNDSGSDELDAEQLKQLNATREQLAMLTESMNVLNQSMSMRGRRPGVKIDQNEKVALTSRCDFNNTPKTNFKTNATSTESPPISSRRQRLEERLEEEKRKEEARRRAEILHMIEEEEREASNPPQCQSGACAIS